MSKTPILVGVTDTHLKESNADLNLSIYKQAIKYAKQFGIDTVVHAGDVFDSRKAQPLNNLKSFESILDLLAEHKIKLLTIPGNHDKVDYESESSYLDAFCHHPAMHLVRTYEYGLRMSIMVHYIPFFKETTCYRQYLDLALDVVRQNPDRSHVLITHIAIDGVYNNDGSQVENHISRESFSAFDKVIVGHYHNSSKIGRNIHYVGSTMPHSFGDNNDKGIFVMYDDGSLEVLDTDFIRYNKKTVCIDDYTEEQIVGIVKNMASDDQAKCKLKITGDRNRLQTLDLESLKQYGVKITTISDEARENIESAVREDFIKFDSTSIMQAFATFVKHQQLTEDEIKVGKYYLVKFLKQYT